MHTRQHNGRIKEQCNTEDVILKCVPTTSIEDLCTDSEKKVIVVWVSVLAPAPNHVGVMSILKLLLGIAGLPPLTPSPYHGVETARWRLPTDVH